MLDAARNALTAVCRWITRLARDTAWHDDVCSRAWPHSPEPERRSQ